MTTGRHIVRDISCRQCHEVVGWKYDKAFEQSEKYKEGKYILEAELLVTVRWAPLIYLKDESLAILTSTWNSPCSTLLKLGIFWCDKGAFWVGIYSLLLDSIHLFRQLYPCIPVSQFTVTNQQGRLPFPKKQRQSFPIKPGKSNGLCWMLLWWASIVTNFSDPTEEAASIIDFSVEIINLLISFTCYMTGKKRTQLSTYSFSVSAYSENTRLTSKLEGKTKFGLCFSLGTSGLWMSSISCYVFLSLLLSLSSRCFEGVYLFSYYRWRFFATYPAVSLLLSPRQDKLAFFSWKWSFALVY